MKIDSKSFRVPPGKKVDLGKWPTSVDLITSQKSSIRSFYSSTWKS